MTEIQYLNETFNPTTELLAKRCSEQLSRTVDNLDILFILISLYYLNVYALHSYDFITDEQYIRYTRLGVGPLVVIGALYLCIIIIKYGV